MTTHFSTIKFALAKFYCRGVSHEKQKTAFWTIFLSVPKAPAPLKKRNFYFYCRLAVSEFPISPHHPIRANRANRFARITRLPLASCETIFSLVAHDCGYPLSRYTCRATRVAADFLDFIAFCRCSTGVALHPLKILVSHLPPPCAGRCRTEIWV